jgi:hypothetical protein
LGKLLIKGSFVNEVLKSAFIKVVVKTALSRASAGRQKTFIKLISKSFL